MHRWQEIRAVALGPLLEGLTRTGITPGMITFASLICGIAVYPSFFITLPLAFALLLAHVLLDGLDGPLARHQGAASRAGSFTDTMADQIVVTLVSVAAIKAGWAGIEAGVAYLITYAAVVTFAMVRNAMAIPYSWVVRPRFLVYLWLPLEAYLWPDTLEMVLWLCSGLLGMKVVSGFFKIRHGLVR